MVYTKNKYTGHFTTREELERFVMEQYRQGAKGPEIARQAGIKPALVYSIRKRCKHQAAPRAHTIQFVQRSPTDENSNLH